MADKLAKIGGTTKKTDFSQKMSQYQRHILV